MRALRWHGTRDLRLEDVPAPVATSLLDAIVAVDLCGICGTDITEFRSGPAMIWDRPHPLSGHQPPLTLGHELVGRVVSGGSSDGTIGVGDRVTVDACLRCGQCAACRNGDYHRCRHGGSVGVHSDGGFARLIAVPGDVLVAVPDAVTDEQAALTEPFAVGLHALERGDLRPGDSLIVLGFGPIGAATALVARALGADPVVIELDPDRREAAERLGLRTVPGGPEAHRGARRLVGGGGADVVVESTGVAAVVPQAIDAAARGGRIVLAGLPTRTSEIDARRITLFERSLIGSLGYRHDLPKVLRLVAAGRLDPAAIITETIALDDAAATIERLSRAPGGSLKVVVRLSDEPVPGVEGAGRLA